MAFEISTFQLPHGARCARVEVSGTLSTEDARAIIGQLNPGGPLHGLPILGLASGLGSIAPEARSIAGEGKRVKWEAWTAVVVDKPLIRVSLSFIWRVQRAKKKRLFATEREAILWLDERSREDPAKPKAP